MKIFFLVLFLTISIQAFSQTSIGFRAGATFSTWEIKEDGLTQRLDRLTAFTIGIPFEFRLSNLFSIQPELNYISRGGELISSQSFSGSSYELKQTLKINYLEIPVFGKLSFTSGKIRLDLLAGPGISYGLDGITKVKTTINGQATTVKESVDFEDDQIEREDFSLNLGLDLVFNSGNNKIFCDFRYQYGLTNLAAPANSNSTDEVSAHDNTIQVCVGMLFPIQSSKSKAVPPPKK